MNRAQRVALTVALAVALSVAGWAVVPFSVAGRSCGSAVTAVFADDPRGGPAWYVSRRVPCSRSARDRLVTGAVVVVLAGAFAAGSYRLLADPRAATD